MKPSIDDVIKEIKDYSYLRNFDPTSLRQLAEFFEEGTYKVGDIVLKEGEVNTKLFIIRKGEVEVLLINDVIATLSDPSDVMGEISVLLDRKTSKTVRVSKELTCWIFDSERLKTIPADQSEHYQALFFRFYSFVVADRLAKTREKARLFEIANKELHQAQLDLEMAGEKCVLLVDTNRKQLIISKVALANTGVVLHTANSAAEADALLGVYRYDAIICEDKCASLLKKLHQDKSSTQLILMTSKEVEKNIQTFREYSFVDTLITRDNEDRSSAIKMIMTTLTKVLRHEIFGIESYLSWGVSIQEKMIRAHTNGNL